MGRPSSILGQRNRTRPRAVDQSFIALDDGILRPLTAMTVSAILVDLFFTLGFGVCLETVILFFLFVLLLLLVRYYVQLGLDLINKF
jgi:hypothetical protein